MSGLQKRALEAAKAELKAIDAYKTYSAIKKKFIELGVDEKVFNAAWDNSSDARNLDSNKISAAVGWLNALLEESK